MEVFEHMKCVNGLRLQVGSWVPLHSQKLVSPLTRFASLIERALTEIDSDVMNAISMYDSKIAIASVRSWTGFTVEVAQLYSEPNVTQRDFSEAMSIPFLQ